MAPGTDKDLSYSALTANSHAVPPARRLVWLDEAKTPEPTSDELRQLQAAFWAKVAPPIYDIRGIDCPVPLELDWD